MRKVTFIGVRSYDSYAFHVPESSEELINSDKMFGLWINTSMGDISSERLFILSKLGYDIEIIGDGKEEFEELCKEMEG